MTTSIRSELSVEEAGRLLVNAQTYTSEERMHEVFAVLRAHDSIPLIEHPDFPPVWALTKHHDITDVAQHSTEWLQSKPQSLRSYAELKAISEMNFPPLKFLVNMDGSEHRAYRNITASWFQPKNLARLDERLRTLAAATANKMADLGGTCDFASDISIPLPMQVILSILGLPEDDYPLMLRMTQQMLAPADPEFAVAPGATPGETFTNSVETFYEYFLAVREDRRRNPTEDLSTLLALAEVPEIGEMPIDALVGYYVIFAVAGHDTTASSIAGGMRALIENPDQFERLKADPSLIPSAVNEIFRWVSPARHFLRTANAPYRIGDQEFVPGDKVFLSFPSANRDAAVFEDPYKFDVGRTHNSHLAFGFGPHYCLGVHLAKMQLTVLFEELTRRIRWVELDGEPEMVASIIAGGLKRLPIKYEMV